MKTMFEKVREFHVKFGHPAPDKLTRLTENRKDIRSDWMDEELTEYYEANTLIDEVDGLIDELYFVFGTLCEHGLTNEQVEKCFDAVHTANMKKVAHTNKKKKVLKPEDWISPEEEIGKILNFEENNEN